MDDTEAALPVPPLPDVGSLSPSRTAEFRACALRYRFRAIDRLPEPASSAAVRGTVVHEGDVVETGPGGRAQLRMVDGAMIDLEPGSTLRLAEYQLAAQPANHRSLLELVRGGLRTLTGVIGQQNQPGYELRVRTVTIGVRGTEYRTELQGEQVVLDVLQGRVALCNPAGCVDVARGESARAPLSGALPARTAAATVPGGAAAGAATPGAALPTVPGGSTPGLGAVPVPRVSVDGQPVPVTLLPATPAAPATPAGPSGPAAPALPAAPGQPVAPAAPADPGSPATPEELRKRFDTLISERGKGKDATKLRFVIE